jgi:hypothetical protein
MNKAQGMFRSDAVLVDIADLYACRVAADDPLRAAMGARSRPGYALRTLLNDEEARAVAAGAVTPIAGGAGTTPVVLSLPSPARWLVVSAELSRQPAAPPMPTGPTPPPCTSPTSCGSSRRRPSPGSSCRRADPG